MPFPHPIRSLAQVPGLAALHEISREFDVEITAFGSLVRRLARSLLLPPAGNERKEEPLPDLFELAPFLSDIDLRHSGKPEQTDDIRKAILGRVPFSECFRWQIFSEEELKEFTDDEVHRPVIPVNKLRLGSRAGRGIEDPFGAVADLITGRFRLLRSAFFSRSSLRRAHRDAELLYAMELLKVWCEDPRVPLEQQPGWPVARHIAADSRTPALLGALEESAYLRAKLKYRSQALRASCRNARDWLTVTGDDGIGPALEYVDQGIPYQVLDIDLRDSRNGLESLLASSCRLVGDRFRLRMPPIAGAAYERAEKLWTSFREDGIRRELDLLSRHALPRLPPGHRIVADTPEFRFNLGRAPSETDDEHLHFQLTLTKPCARQCRKYGEEGLAAFLLLTAQEEPIGRSKQTRSLALPLPAVCWLPKSSGFGNESWTRLQIRANCGRWLEALPDLLSQIHPDPITSYQLKLFVVGQS